MDTKGRVSEGVAFFEKVCHNQSVNLHGWRLRLSGSIFYVPTNHRRGGGRLEEVEDSGFGHPWESDPIMKLLVILGRQIFGVFSVCPITTTAAG